ncbi:MAG: hypothetical protein P4M02_06525 [Clostridia bacterium]|nr:hypothetical protein [Clostridia bacterium]
MNQNGIAVAGNLLIDYHKEIDVYPAASTLTTIRRVSASPGGAVCNCAIDLAQPRFRVDRRILQSLPPTHIQ